MYEKTKICYICKKNSEHKYTNDKVKDHCYYKSKFRVSVHSICNLTLMRLDFLKVVFSGVGGICCYLLICNKEVSKNQEKILKIVKIEEENLHNF